MNKTFLRCLLLLSCLANFGPSSMLAEDFFVAQTALGKGDGLSSQDAKAVTFVNSAANWNSPAKLAGKIGPGDVVRLVGVITSPISVQASGIEGGPITILFEPGAKMIASAWASSGAINLFQKDYIIIDGGARGQIGGVRGDATLINGSIENSDNGTNRANQVSSTGIAGNGCRNIIIKNLALKNLYVRVAGTSLAGGGSAITLVDGNGRGMRNLKITNCYIHDSQTGVNFDYGTTDASNYELSFTTIFNVNWGGRCGDRGSSSVMDDLRVHDNYFHDFTNWDTPTDSQYHHNGFYAWAESGGKLNRLSFYNNVVGPNFSNCLNGYNAATAGIFVSGNAVGPVLVYNNIFVNNTGNGPSNGMITFGTKANATLRVCNNTFVGGSGAQSINFSNMGSGSLNVFVQNNLFTGADFAISCLYNKGVTLISSNNLGFGLVASPFKWSSTGSGGGMSLESWRATTGQDGNFLTSNPLLNSDFKLTTGSPAIGAGINLSEFLTTDAQSVTRSLSGNWDIGAFAINSGATVLPTLMAPSNTRVSNTGF